MILTPGQDAIFCASTKNSTENNTPFSWLVKDELIKSGDKFLVSIFYIQILIN